FGSGATSGGWPGTNADAPNTARIGFASDSPIDQDSPNPSLIFGMAGGSLRITSTVGAARGAAPSGAAASSADDASRRPRRDETRESLTGHLGKMGECE